MKPEMQNLFNREIEVIHQRYPGLFVSPQEQGDNLFVMMSVVAQLPFNNEAGLKMAAQNCLQQIAAIGENIYSNMADSHTPVPQRVRGKANAKNTYKKDALPEC